MKNLPLIVLFNFFNDTVNIHVVCWILWSELDCIHCLFSSATVRGRSINAATNKPRTRCVWKKSYPWTTSSSGRETRNVSKSTFSTVLSVLCLTLLYYTYIDRPRRNCVSVLSVIQIVLLYTPQCIAQNTDRTKQWNTNCSGILYLSHDIACFQFNITNVSISFCNLFMLTFGYTATPL